MAWTNGDFKIFAAGLAIGGKYNHTHGTLPRVKSSVASGTYWYTQYFTLSCDLTEATILYSIDGGTPTTVYAGEEIYIGDDMVCLAYAIYGQGLSLMSRFRYIVDNPLVQKEKMLLPPYFSFIDTLDLGTDTIVFELIDTVTLSESIVLVTNEEFNVTL